MTPQEHLAQAELYLSRAKRFVGHPSPEEVHSAQLALVHVQAGQLAQQLVTFDMLVEQAKWDEQR